jgi:mono/diheme cytochrome c family protein
VPPVPEDLLVSVELREHGQALFLKHCALCHGERGDGNGVRRSLSKPAADLTDVMWRRRASAEAVYLAIRDGIPRSPMAAWSVFSEQQTWALTAHVLHLAEEDI